jgi:RimJ/RimL family protein N-acetyltransferase
MPDLARRGEQIDRSGAAPAISCNPQPMTDLIAPVVQSGTLAEIPQPVLDVDDELLLRPWRADDAPTVVRAFSDPAIQHWHFRRYDTDDDARAWIAECDQQWRSEKCATWAIARRASGAVAGRVAMYVVLKDGYGEVTYWILPEARRHGIATRAVRAATRWAHDLGLHRVELQHSTRNTPSQGVARNAGFVSEGVRRGANLHEDGWHDMHLYSHLATDETHDS